MRGTMISNKMRRLMLAVRILFLTLFTAACTTAAASVPGVISVEFLNGANPAVPSSHASTIEMTPGGLVAAWFGGQYERHSHVGIWLTRQVNGMWLDPVEVADGVQYTRPDGSVHRHPTWNPVLFQYPGGGPLMLFYKCGPTPDSWWGMVMSSTDGGTTWTTPVRLPEQIDGPVRNKPILLDDGTLLCGSSTEFDGWRLHFEFTKDQGATWQRVPAIHDGKTFGAIQPSLMRHADGRIEALCRNQNSEGQVLTTSTADGGKTWSTLKETNLPNPNSGIDGVVLKDGRSMLIYNHTKRSTKPAGREMLNIGISEDKISWQAAGVLENTPKSEFSYPAIIQSADGMVHVTYTWKRKLIRYVKIDPAKLQLKPFNGSNWPF